MKKAIDDIDLIRAAIALRGGNRIVRRVLGWPPWRLSKAISGRCQRDRCFLLQVLGLSSPRKSRQMVRAGDHAIWNTGAVSQS